MRINGDTKLEISEVTTRERTLTVEELADEIGHSVRSICYTLSHRESAPSMYEALVEEIDASGLLDGYDDSSPTDVVVLETLTYTRV